MEIQVVTQIEEFCSYQRQWDLILREMKNDNPFLEIDYLIKWWEHFKNNRDLFILVVYHKNEIVGFCPLMKEKKRGYSIFRFMGGKIAHFMDFVILPSYKKEAIFNILHYLNTMTKPHLISIHGLLSSYRTSQIVQEYFQNNKINHHIQKSVCWYVPFHEEEFESYFKKRTKTHKSLKRIVSEERKLNKLGIVEFKLVSKEEVDKIFALHEKKWRKKYDNSGFSKGKIRDFYLKLIEIENSSIKPVIFGLYVRDLLIAFDYGISYKGRLSLLRGSYDPDFGKYGLGKMLVKEVIQQAYNEKLNKIDFGTGNHAYKTVWTDNCVDVYSVHFSSRHIWMRMKIYLIHIIDNIKFWILSHPKMLDFRISGLPKLQNIISRQFFHEVITNTKRLIENHGYIEAIRLLCKKLIEPVFQKESKIIFEKMTTSCGEDDGLKKNCIQQANIEDITLLAETMNVHPKEVIFRFENQHRCFLKKEKNQILFYLWINNDPIRLDDKMIVTFDQKRTHHIYDYFFKKGTEKDMRFWIAAALQQIRIENQQSIYFSVHRSHLFLQQILNELGSEVKWKIEFIQLLKYPMSKISRVNLPVKEKMIWM